MVLVEQIEKSPKYAWYNFAMLSILLNLFVVVQSQMYLQQRVAYVRQLRERNRLQFQSAVEAPKANRQVTL